MQKIVNKEHLRDIPGPPGNLFLGSFREVGKDPLAYLEKYIPEFDGAIQVISHFRKLCFVYKPEWIKYILQDNNKNYHKSFGYEVMSLFLGNGLLTSEGDFWRKQRRLMQPLFARKAISRFHDIMINSCHSMIGRWQNSFLRSGQAFDLAEEMSLLTMDIVARCMLSIEIGDDSHDLSEAFTMANRGANERIMNPFLPPLWFPTPSNRKFKKALNLLDDTVYGIINERRQNEKQENDLLDMLLHAKDADTSEQMDDKQLRDEVLTIFIAGHETTANAMSWTFHCLLDNPVTYENLQDEVSMFMTNSDISHEMLASMDLTKNSIKESMRLYPPAWIVGRLNLEDDVLGDYFLPAKTNVLIPTYNLHRNPEYWEEPLKFKPNRFANRTFKGVEKFIYFPFGGGPRLCIGEHFAMMEMQILLPTIIRHFKIIRADNQKVSPEPLITLRPKNGIWVKIKENV